MHKSILEKRVWLIVAVQVAVIIGSLLLAFALRFDMKIPVKYWPTLWALLPFLLLVDYFLAYGAVQRVEWPI